MHSTITDGPLVIDAPGERGLDGDAIRARIANRLFGVESDPVRIGRFELIERIGAGGMGIVCAAFDPSLDRKVAIKVLSPRRAGSLGHRHLLEEAKTLARLAHPNVVTVHEVSENDGDIFVVMEYVDGQTLGEWQRGDRTLEEIVSVYAQAAAGLAAAHELGLVHRDFKPSNVLVGADGRVRVADFGLARMSRSTNSCPSNPEESQVDGGTPAYMSPEQAAGVDVDAASDQFSFCVALWEAACGRRPFRAEQIVALGDEPTRRIAPSKGTRRMPSWLVRALSRGLHACPEKRWASIGALRSALLEGPRRTRRKTLGALSTVGVGSIALASWLTPDPCPSAEHRFDGIWDETKRAEVELAMRSTGLPFAEKSWSSASARLDVYAAGWAQIQQERCIASRTSPRESPTRTRQITRCLDRRLVALGSVVDLLGQGDADIVASATSLAASLPPISDCSRPEILEIEGGTDDERDQTIEATQRAVERVHQLLQVGRHREAVRLAEEALTASDELGHPPTAAAAKLARGLTRRAFGDVSGAEGDLLEAAFAAEAGRYDPIAADAWRTLVVLGSTDLDDLARVATWQGLARAAVARMGNPVVEHADLLEALGRIEDLKQSHDAAQALYREALALRDEALGPDDVNRATTLRLLANSLAYAGEREEALHEYARARAILDKVHGPGHPEVAQVDLNVALTLAQMGDTVAAEQRAEGALEVWTRVFGADSLRVTPAEVFLAQLAFGRGDWERGERLAKHAWLLQQRELPRGHSERGMALAIFANASMTGERYVEALEAHEVLLDEFSVGANQAQLGSLRQNTGWLLCQLDRCSEGRPYFEGVLSEAPIGSRLAAYAELGLADADLADDQPQLARNRLDRVRPVVQSHAEHAPEILAQSLLIEARTHTRLAAPEPALEAARRARSIYETIDPESGVLTELGTLIDELSARASRSASR